MSNGSHKLSLKKNAVLILVCVILMALMAGLLIWNRISQAEEGKRLESLAEKRAEEVEPETEEPKETEPEEAEPETTEPEAPAVAGISCWGEAFYAGEEVGSSYRATLQSLLQENGYELTVVDQTLLEAGSLSSLKLAGVPQAEIDAYVARHREAAGAAEPKAAEVVVRDFSPEQMERTDADYIPVIFLGYYGGWNHDVNELIEQQNKILGTFQANKDRCVIVGLAPSDGSVDQAAYDAAMSSAYGEKYLSVPAVTAQNPVSPEGQREIGQAVYNKIIELGYL